MGRITDQLKSASLNKEVLLLEANSQSFKQMPSEATEIQVNYENFGIKNKTVKFIKEKRTEFEDANARLKTKKITTDGINLIMDCMFPYKIVTYDVLDQVAKDHGLIISSLSFYNEGIDEENIQELKNFKHLFGKKADLFGTKVSFPRSNEFMFAGEHFSNVYNVDFTNYFNIVAPKSHFDFGKKNMLSIGHEVKEYPKAPGLKLDLQFNVPEPKDPIIVAPFVFMKRIYNIIVTSWDEVADDLRIRQQIEN